MDPRYATFIWACFGIAALAVVWNAFAPYFQRNKLVRQLSEQRDDNDYMASNYDMTHDDGHSAGSSGGDGSSD